MIRVTLALLLALQLVVIVPPKARPGKRMLFLVDTSGSMLGNSFGKALGAVDRFARQPVDEMHLGVIAFADGHRRWRYGKRRWAKLPDQRAVRDASRWIYLQGVGGGTKLAPALEAALRDPARELTVVVVSDGIFSESDAALLNVLARGQRRRARAKLPRAVVIGFGVGSSSSAHMSSSSAMAKLGRAGKGGFFR